MTKEDLRSYAMYGLSVLLNKSYQRYKESNYTDKKASDLCHYYGDLWNELFNEKDGE